MSSDVWFRRDIGNALLATYESKAQTLAMFGDDPKSSAYLAGIRDTLSTLALMFGISPALVIPERTGAPQLDRGNGSDW